MPRDLRRLYASAVMGSCRTILSDNAILAIIPVVLAAPTHDNVLPVQIKEKINPAVHALKASSIRESVSAKHVL
jgi:hypothetical protein